MIDGSGGGADAFVFNTNFDGSTQDADYPDCPVCPVGSACPYFGIGSAAGLLVTDFTCEDAAASYDSTAGWFIGRDCSAPTTYIMPLKSIYGWYIWQVGDGGTTDGATTECPEDHYCNADGVTAPIRCEDGYKCNTRTTHQYPNLWPVDGIYQNWYDGQISGELCTECLLVENYEVSYDGARALAASTVTMVNTLTLADAST